MTNAYDQFLMEDDDILASVLEESLRHYNEVELPLLTIDQNSAPTTSNNVNKVNSQITVIDLCESPKKCPTVQSRLSRFFKKPENDKTCVKKTNDEIGKQSNQLDVEPVSVPENNVSISSSPPIFYKEPDANGFHLSSGSHFVYPSNFPVREYQMEIIKTALFHNTLVSLPTGLGKTFIAAVVMYNFYRWYPMGKIVFMAPTRPLVAQQIEACHSIMGIPRDMTFEMTGNIPPEQRYLAWNKYRVFFLTPQVLANDLSVNKCPSEMLRCIIVDEAHRATKDYAYVQVLKQLSEANRIIRIVGLSATPGTTVEAVTEVIQNLNISRLEFRTDESLDVAKYTNKKEIECIPVKLTNAILNIRSQFLVIYDKYSRRLKQYHALSGNVSNLAKFQILGAKQKFLASNTAREMPKSLVGCLINDFTICMSLSYALELLTVYGIKVFYLQSLEILDNHKCLSNDADFQKLLHDINRELNSQDLTWSHPKLIELKKIVQKYFGNENTESNSKIIIFCQYRLVVVEVFELLKTFGSSVKPVMFVGQSLKEKGGLAQKKQLEVMTRFKSGDFNVLIATSVAEEGLDIGEVDLIICLESNKSPIKFVQRLGRTGRKRSGKCITLLTEGKEQMKYKSSVSSSKTLVIKMLKNKTILSKLGQGGPRLVPKHIKPQLLMIHVKQSEDILPETKKGKGKKKSYNSIKQFLGPSVGQNNEEIVEEEDGLDVFQNINDKPKRKSKKLKTVELESNQNVNVTERSAEQNRDFNLIDDDFILPGDGLVAEDEKCRNTGSGHDSGRFVDEEMAFNEWLQSCKQIDSVTLNDKFFKLLLMFTDRATTADDHSPARDHLTCNVDADENDDECSMAVEQPRPNDVADCETSDRRTDVAPASVNDCRLRTRGESAKPGNGSGDLLTSENRVGRAEIVCDEPIANPSAISSGGAKSKTNEPDRRNVNESNKIDFDILFTGQRVNKYIEDYMERGGSRRDRPVREEPSRPVVMDETIDLVSDDSDDAAETAGDVVDDEVDEDEGDVVFEEFFKSQRADKYIEKYNEAIVGASSNDEDGSDDSIGPENGVGRSIATGREFGGLEDWRTGDDAHESRKSAEKTDGNVDVDEILDCDAIRVPPRENNSGDDEDISLDDSPEFFSCKLPKKKLVRTRFTEHVHADPEPCENFDLSTPPNPVENDRCPTEKVAAAAAATGNVSTVTGNVSNATGSRQIPTVTFDDDDDDMDFMFVDYCSGTNAENDVFTQKLPPTAVPSPPAPVAVRSPPSPVAVPSRSTPVAVPSRSTPVVVPSRSAPVAVPSRPSPVAVPPTTCSRPYVGGPLPSLSITKAFNLFKPGFSLKRNTTSATVRPPAAARPPPAARPPVAARLPPAEKVSPVHFLNRQPFGFSQSTPKAAAAKRETAANVVAANLLASSSSSSSNGDDPNDVFVNGGDKKTPPSTIRRRRCVRKKRRRRKSKKKLLFIDDEADVSNNYEDTSGTAAAARVNSSSSEFDDDGELDSSFIDDDLEKSEPSTSMTKQYLQSVKSQINGRGVFKIPKLTGKHLNIDVYSQMADRNENNDSYEEDSFCVKDSSDLNSSSNASALQTSEKRPSKSRKRKRILSPQSSDSDSPARLNRNKMRKRIKAKMSLDSS